MLTHYKTLDGTYCRVNIYTNEFQEYVLRCFKDGVHVKDCNYHTTSEQDALTEANNFLNRKG